MKIVKRSLFALAMGGLLVSQTGCFGEFALTRKAYNWHASINGKFLRSLLLWIPMGLVYSVTAFVDTVILNLIEFWSGSNPLSMMEGEHEEQLLTINGEDFKLEATKDTFTATQLTGKDKGVVRIMRFDRTDLTWKYSDDAVCDVAVMTFLDDRAENVRVYTDEGTMDLATADLGNDQALMARYGMNEGTALTCAR